MVLERKGVFLEFLELGTFCGFYGLGLFFISCVYIEIVVFVGFELVWGVGR